MRSDPLAVRAVIVAIPSRNEQERIAACVRSVRAAAQRVGDGVRVVIVVASDDSTDDTDIILESLADRHLVFWVRGVWRSAGGARRTAVAYGSSLIQSDRLSWANVWIASTDADTTVPESWLADQLRFADVGYDAVAGLVDLTVDYDLSDELLAGFAAQYTVIGDSHDHVHGANLGVRGSAYWAADGFPHVDLAEDHALWNELHRRKFRLVSPVDLRVSTSARLVGRAAGGFADTCAEIFDYNVDALAKRAIALKAAFVAATVPEALAG